MAELQLFLNSLEFCNAVIQVAHPLVQKQLLEFVYQGFLVSVIGPALHQVQILHLLITVVPNASLHPINRCTHYTSQDTLNIPLDTLEKNPKYLVCDTAKLLVLVVSVDRLFCIPPPRVE